MLSCICGTSDWTSWRVSETWFPTCRLHADRVHRMMNMMVDMDAVT